MPSTDEPREHFRRLCERFASAALAERFAEAYEMTSTYLRDRMDPEAFEAAHRDAWEEWGRPDGLLGVDYNSLDAGELASQDADYCGFPDYVPAAARRARVVAELGTTDLWINFCEENGEDRIASFEYEEPD
jgi:hypothetical protein